MSKIYKIYPVNPENLVNPVQLLPTATERLVELDY
jgi:hypothetical protein